MRLIKKQNATWYWILACAELTKNRGVIDKVATDRTGGSLPKKSRETRQALIYTKVS